MKQGLSPADAADLIDRFINERERYPQEWNDFVEALKVEPEVETFRKRCYELDPFVNRPGGADPGTMQELKEIVSELRGMTNPSRH